MALALAGGLMVWIEDDELMDMDTDGVVDRKDRMCFAWRVYDQSCA